VRAEAVRIAAALTEAPLTTRASASLLPTAVELACETRRTVYECLYLALAISERCKLVTADAKLCRALSVGDFADEVRWVEDLV